MTKKPSADLRHYLEMRFREWASSAVRMRDTLKLQPNDEGTRRARSTLARADAEKARFYFQQLQAACH